MYVYFGYGKVSVSCLEQHVFIIINKKYIHACMYILAVEK